jgi:tetratricopeptide (TPR) repeat protein
MKEKYLERIRELDENITEQPDIYEFYEERGYLYFLLEQYDKAKEDYRKAVSLGLDFTEYPYYSFSNQNSRRRDFSLPEKILVFLILLMVLAALIFQVLGFIMKASNTLPN